MQRVSRRCYSTSVAKDKVLTRVSQKRISNECRQVFSPL